MKIYFIDLIQKIQDLKKIENLKIEILIKMKNIKRNLLIKKMIKIMGKKDSRKNLKIEKDLKIFHLIGIKDLIKNLIEIYRISGIKNF